jgi:multiple antibiotic resistance protein
MAMPKLVAWYPLPFPLLAGSGTLTTIMSLKANYDDVNIFIGILVNCV